MNKLEKRQLDAIHQRLNWLNHSNKEKFEKEKTKPEKERNTQYLSVINENYTSITETIVLLKEVIENFETFKD